MNDSITKPSFATALPRWQVLLVLVGFPLVYLLNNFTPWSLGLFVRHDRSWFVPFMASILVLHWSSLVVTVWLVKKAGGSLAQIGLPLSPTKVAIAAAVFVAWGALLLWYRTTWAMPDEPPTGWQITFPYTFAERVLILCLATSAGICEETIYRGFAIRVLQGRGWKLWQTLLLAGLSFALIHGITGIVALPLFVVVALIFSAIILWRGNLWLAISIHVMWDMMMVLAV